MKVLLLQNVPKIGQKHEIKNVSDGYARNFLLPKKLAVAADDPGTQKLKEKIAQEKLQKETQHAMLVQNLETLKGKSIILVGKSNDNGHLYAALTREDVRKAIKETFGTLFTEEHILLKEPIKELGEHRLLIKLGNNQAELKVIVERKI